MGSDALADGYQMLEELGSGSFGVVYKAIEKSSGEIVAIKHVDLESSEEDITDIQAEITVLSSCASPYVTQYKTAFLRGQKLWIVMEYLGGGSCQDLLKAGTFSEAHIAIICQQLLLGLAYLHSEGKLHRDIKAANVLFAQSGKVKLADFGVAAQLTNIHSLRNTFVGTPFWMAPEVIQQAGHDFKADIWSLGITAMELIHGEPPHASTHPMKVLFLIPKAPAPRLEGSNYSKDFKDFVASCLIKDPDRRPSAKELLRHRFIRNAGRTEALQELIIRRQEWEAGKGMNDNLKYYAETMRSLSQPQDDDDWVFDTVKATPTIHHTQKRRKLTATKAGLDQNDTAAMMENLSLSMRSPDQASKSHELSSTMRKVSDQKTQHSPSMKRPTKKRIPSGQQKQPLGVNMSFGNSPSTVRQFRRVSPTAENVPDPVPSPKGQSNLNSISDAENMPPPLPPPSLSSTTASTIASPTESKESLLGRRTYAKAIGISCQDVLNNTGDQEKREAISRVAEAFSDLEAIDPEGIYHIMKAVVDKMQADTKLLQMLPVTAAAAAAAPYSQPSTMTSHPGTTTTTPLKSGGNNAGKLLLAQNNPHLRSHRRRQSHAQIPRGEDGGGGGGTGGVIITSPRESGEEKAMMSAMPGQAVGGLEHTKALGDVLFERWCEGLRNRWPDI